MSNEYKIELTHCGMRKIIIFFTTQNADGSWYATGLGCSRNYPVEAQAIDALLESECCTDVIWF